MLRDGCVGPLFKRLRRERGCIERNERRTGALRFGNSLIESCRRTAGANTPVTRQRCSGASPAWPARCADQYCRTFGRSCTYVPPSDSRTKAMFSSPVHSWSVAMPVTASRPAAPAPTPARNAATAARPGSPVARRAASTVDANSRRQFGARAIALASGSLPFRRFGRPKTYCALSTRNAGAIPTDLFGGVGACSSIPRPSSPRGTSARGLPLSSIRSW